MGVQATPLIEADFGSGWVDITADTRGADGMRIKYGIDGRNPTDVVAAVGRCSFSLRNDAGNSGGLEGYYSPRHANVRSGWGFGTPIRVSFSSGAISGAVRFRGTVTTIDAQPGAYLGKAVRVTAEDGMRQLLDADLREIAIATSTDEATLIGQVLDALPASAQPVARSLDAGASHHEVAFDDLGSGAKALAVIGQLARAAQGRVFIAGDGTFRYVNRHNLGPLNSVAVTLSNTMHGLAAPSSIDACFNRVRITTHQKTVSASATEVLYEGVVELPGGATQEYWCNYTDPNSGERRTKIGGTAVVTTLVAYTHYYAGTTAGGTELTPDVSATLEAFATTGKFTLTNSGASAAYVTLKIIGKAIRDLGPSVSEASSTQSYGDRTMPIDLTYQGSADFGHQLASALVTLYEDLDNQIEAVEFVANESSTLMAAALQQEPGDAVSVTEQVTGIAAATQVIQGVELTVQAPAWIRCRWTLAPITLGGGAWALDSGALDSTTVLAL